MTELEEIEVCVTYLEMAEPPGGGRSSAPEGVSVVRVPSCTVRYYRFLYDAVGRRWHWVDRKKLSDRALADIIQDDRVEIFVLQVEGVPAGYAELDLRQPPEIEIAYFGLMPEFFGRGLGRWFLSWVVSEAFERQPSRVWLHTCDLDHPAALSNYEKAGFVAYRTERIVQENPRLFERSRRSSRGP